MNPGYLPSLTCAFVGRHCPAATISIALAFVWMAVGCTVSPREITRRHWDYNEAIRKTADEQMLLNIVRLRYDELPYFLQVSGISNSISRQQTIGVSGTATEGGPGVIGATGSLSFADNPIITWSLPESREFFGRLMAPLGADQLNVLAQSGWSVNRVMRFGVKKINRIRNVQYDYGYGFYEPDTVGEFTEMLDLIHDLQTDDLIDFAYAGYRSSLMTQAFPLAQLNTRALPAGLPLGLYFLESTVEGEEGMIRPVRLSTPLVMRFSKAADDDPRARRLRDLLDLNPQAYSFGLVNPSTSSLELIRTGFGQVSTAFDSDTPFSDIQMTNRSMLELMNFASYAIEVPQSHVDARMASPGRGGGLGSLRIRSSSSKPSNPWLSVEHKGAWFYIPYEDEASRDDFLLLLAMYNVSIGTVPGATPLLTLPVN